MNLPEMPSIESNQRWNRLISMESHRTVAIDLVVVAVAVEAAGHSLMAHVIPNFAPLNLAHRSTERNHYAMLEMVTGNVAAIERKSFDLSLWEEKKEKKND